MVSEQTETLEQLKSLKRRVTLDRETAIILGDCVTQTRISAELDQRALAEKLGTDQFSISRIEHAANYKNQKPFRYSKLLVAMMSTFTQVTFELLVELANNMRQEQASLKADLGIDIDLLPGKVITHPTEKRLARQYILNDGSKYYRPGYARGGVTFSIVGDFAFNNMEPYDVSHADFDRMMNFALKPGRNLGTLQGTYQAPFGGDVAHIIQGKLP